MIRGLLRMAETACKNSTGSTRFLALFFLLGIFYTAGCSDKSDIDYQLENSIFLLNLPANRWIKYHEMNDGDWWRQGHAGLAYDSNRGNLLLFGSDTHGENWDNIIHEFNIKKREWVHHGISAPESSYRVTTEGYLVAGNEHAMPLAMHTYDGVVYDPQQDSLVVVASPDHTPLDKKLPEPRFHPIWIYSMTTKRWLIFDQKNLQTPRFFGAATAYDGFDNNLFICKSGLWVLNLDKGQLRRVGGAPDCLHRTMEFDSLNRRLFLFGSYRGTANILRYDIGFDFQEAREWQELVPIGDQPPPYSSTPVAFDEKSGVFIMVVDDKESQADKRSESAATFIYEPRSNGYRRLLEGRLPAIGMNFMMVWDRVHELFFLLTGDWREGISVWVLRLDLDAMR